MRNRACWTTEAFRGSRKYRFLRKWELDTGKSLPRETQTGIRWLRRAGTCLWHANTMVLETARFYTPLLSGKWLFYAPLERRVSSADKYRAVLRSKTSIQKYGDRHVTCDNNYSCSRVYTAHSWAVPRSVKTQAWLSPSAKSVWHFTSPPPPLFSLCLPQHYPAVLQRKISYQCLEHSVSRTAWDCWEPENFFFFAQIVVFTRLSSFWSVDVTRNEENNNSGL